MAFNSAFLIPLVTATSSMGTQSFHTEEQIYEWSYCGTNRLCALRCHELEFMTVRWEVSGGHATSCRQRRETLPTGLSTTVVQIHAAYRSIDQTKTLD